MFHHLQYYALSSWIIVLYGLWNNLALVSAQLVNGQFYTSGLAISNAPAPGSQYSAGGAIGVSVDVSGNGRLPISASTPGSTLPTAFISLNIFLISSQTNTNVTVTSGTQFLEGEPGSTVKHLNFAIPSCLKTGDYNYTYYEVSRVNEETYFSITPIPIFILNNQSGDESCDGSTEPEAQPQPSSPPPEQPFLGAGFSLTTGFSQINAPTNTLPGTQDTVTVTLTKTVVSTIPTSIAQTQTLTFTDGSVSTVTTAIPTLLPTTITTVLTTASANSFVPINAGCRTLPNSLFFVLFTGNIWLVLI
ncbi:hypothetical protein BN14_01431 [Rhizoctonia solani AG-1 IB]|uniref:Uncharacterized protein n=2 Tax=Rhizoctonia solani TaxID=456999 RepID=A0A8H2XDE0_9AGAM|nr:unnamed protein product [Rhizoctonia solani]CCO27393.1 hypothetical protein BN14_01431 [Rhizoctonia solani AG-1 IB]